MGLFAARQKGPAQAERRADLENKMLAMERSQAVIEFNLDGTVIDANENFLRTLGYGLDELKGRHHRIFMDPIDAVGEPYKTFWGELNEGRFVAGKFRRLDKFGREVWLQATYNPVLDAHGRPYKVIKFAVDITEAEQRSAQREAERVAVEQAQRDLVELLAENLKKLAEGDLTTTIDASLTGVHEQVKNDFNQALVSLRQTLDAISAATGGVNRGADESASASHDLSRRTERQAASLEETAAALDQITLTVKRSSEGARLASNAVSETKAEAERSGAVVGEAIAAMGQIERSAGEIGTIIAVIDEIAFQTNLLALNAGVEAARAGDAGRGFAVVASEVRALAQRSAGAAKQIKALISASGAEVARGVTLVGATGDALNGIIGKVSHIDTLISEMASSSQEQAMGLVEINSAIGQMDQFTQQNAAMVEEATAAAASLKGEAAELARLVGQFRTGSSGTALGPELAQPGRHAPVASPVANAQARAKAFARGETQSFKEF